MKLKRVHPKDLAVDLLNRSTCAVQVAAVLVDKTGIYGWGWNSVGTGFGIHAEAHCLLRSNRRRWRESIMYVAAKRKKSGGTVTSKPCEECAKLVRKVGRVVYRDKDEVWKALK